MAARASVAIADAESTPVTHTYLPIGSSPEGINLWQLLPASGVGVGAELLKMSFRPPVNGSPMFKAEFRLFLPTLEVTSGGTGSGYVAAPVLAYANQAVLTFLMHQRSTLQERKNLRKLVNNFCNVANPLNNAVENLESVWG